MSKVVGGLFGGGGGGGTTTVSSSPNIPQYVQDFQKDIFGRAKTAADTLGARQFAGFTPMQQQAFSQIGNLNAGFGNSLTGAQQALAGQATNPFLGGAISQYMNPYTNDVINATMSDLERSRQLQQQQVNANAISRGAFGGSRQAVAEAENDRNFLDTQARTAAQLRSQGFDTALAAAQSDAGRQQQAFQLLNNAFLGNLDAMLGAGEMQQGMTQQQLDAVRNLPMEQLGILSGAFEGAQLPYGTSQTTTTPRQKSNVLGGLLGVAQVAGGLGWKPF